MTHVWRRLRKTVFALADPVSRSALRVGAAPTIEHLEAMRAMGNIKTVIDVGANIGQFALMARRVFPEAVIHSFEPMPDACERFERALRRAKGVHLHKMALGATVTRSEMYITRRQDSSSLLKPDLQSKIYPGGEVVDKVEISVVPLDQVLDDTDLRPPALLKIDVQGFEWEVLLGCKSRLRCFEWIFCELSFRELYAGQRLAPELINWLYDESFELAGVYMSDLSYDSDGGAIQADFLFRRVDAKIRR
jgi:FkbM family methyltransferase